MDRTPIRELMQTKFVTVSVHDTLSTAEDIMRMGRVRHMPVVRGGALVGVVSERDVLRASLSQLAIHAPDARRAFLDGVEIGEVMSSPPVVAAPDTPVSEAALAMSEAKIGCLPVLDGDELVGFVTATDLLRHFGGGRRPASSRFGSDPCGESRG